MSNFEIFLIVMVCAVPVLALLMVLPKKFKKDKKEKKVEPVKTLADLKAEEKSVETKVEEKPKEVKQAQSSEISTDDFKTYLNRRKNISKPSRVELPSDFKDRTTPYIPRRRMNQEKKPQSVAEEIQNLSPELKILIISGALEPKNFDKI